MGDTTELIPSSPKHRLLLETRKQLPGCLRASGSPVPLPLGHRALRWPRSAHQPPHAPPHYDMLVQIKLKHLWSEGQNSRRAEPINPRGGTDRGLPAEGELTNWVRPMAGAQLWEGSTRRLTRPQSQGNPAP